MNEYNHHRIIERFAANVNTLSDTDVQTLKEASNFTDDFIGASRITTPLLTENRFFFYHFYYDIKCENGTIILQRSNSEDCRYDNSMSKCDYNQEKFERQNKLFFSTINDRESYLIDAFVDNSNQSDCVAFLHAMGAKNESKADSYNMFCNHLRSCFSEFLFVKNRKDAVSILGIALHGIMDSFTPSHTGFQKFESQNKATHAQGDVIPIKGVFDAKKPYKFQKGTAGEPEKINYEPGQGAKESILATLFMLPYKGYNGTEIINSTELQMMKIFFIIGELTEKETDLNYAQEYERGGTKFMELFHSFENQLLYKVNERLKSDFVYGEEAYIYSESAIKTMTEVYNTLVLERQRSLNNYDYYKNHKEKIIDDALNCWKSNYDAFQQQVDKKNQLLTSLFLKDSFDNNGLAETFLDYGASQGLQQKNLWYGGLSNL